MTEMQEACKEVVGMSDPKVMVIDGVWTGTQFLTALVHENLGTLKGDIYRPAQAQGIARGQNYY